jgi:hypothetical protein
VNLDFIIGQLEALIGDAPLLASERRVRAGLLVAAVSKLVEARDLADHLTDFEDMEDTETGDMATNFLCGEVATAKGGRA